MGNPALDKAKSIQIPWIQGRKNLVFDGSIQAPHLFRYNIQSCPGFLQCPHWLNAKNTPTQWQPFSTIVSACFDVENSIVLSIMDVAIPLIFK